MPRPTKWRRVSFVPAVTFFKPTGIPMGALESVSLSVEELEAVRLKDQEGLQQEDCARQMSISRPTFHRVLGSARSKISDALINGKAIRIEGGDFEIDRRRFRCGWDDNGIETPVGEIQEEEMQVCSMCCKTNARRQRCRRDHGL